MQTEANGTEDEVKVFDGARGALFCNSLKVRNSEGIYNEAATGAGGDAIEQWNRRTGNDEIRPAVAVIDYLIIVIVRAVIAVRSDRK